MHGQYDAALQHTGKKNVTKIYYTRKPRGTNIPQEAVKNAVIISHEGEGAYVYRGLEETVLVEEVGVITAEEPAHLIHRYAASPLVCVYNRLSHHCPSTSWWSLSNPQWEVTRSTILSVVRTISKLILSAASST